jgi:peptidoglycan/xylan/chitin deacetylase (PgdA/CDA1 family)
LSAKSTTTFDSLEGNANLLQDSFTMNNTQLRDRKAVVLIGYDIEARVSYGDSKSTRLFLEKAVPLHRSFGIPCTGFVLGQTLLENIDEFQETAEDPLWNIEQHTFSHRAFRDVEPINETWKRAKGASIDTIYREISQANILIKEIFGRQCKGICAPKGYYNGLRGRPDILKVLQANSIKFVRSYGRNEDDWMPVAFDIQPFWYKEDGYPEILEIPTQGWQDNIWKRNFGWDNKHGFHAYMKASLDYVVEKQLIWSIAFHDWSCIRGDPDLDIIKYFFEYALNMDVQFMSHLEFFETLNEEEKKSVRTIC